MILYINYIYIIFIINEYIYIHILDIHIIYILYLYIRILYDFLYMCINCKPELMTFPSPFGLTSVNIVRETSDGVDISWPYTNRHY